MELSHKSCLICAPQSANMKVLVFPVIIFSLLLLSCGNQESSRPQAKTLSDSLLKEVLDGHNIGMAKVRKLTQLEEHTQRLLDSIGKLPAKAREASAPYLQKLDSLSKELQYAEFAMNKWMEEFKVDSANNDTEKRVKYLGEEKDKVTKVKDAILSVIQKADSLLKK